jgi:hypothetical protein
MDNNHYVMDDNNYDYHLFVDTLGDKRISQRPKKIRKKRSVKYQLFSNDITEYVMPICNIALLGDNNEINNKLIKLIFSYKANICLISTNVYSKIIFVRDKPVQFNIHEINNLNTILNIKKVFDTVLYLYNTEDDILQYFFLDAIDKMKNLLHTHSTQFIICTRFGLEVSEELIMTDFMNDSLLIKSDPLIKSDRPKNKSSHIMNIEDFDITSNIPIYDITLEDSKELSDLIKYIMNSAIIANRRSNKSLDDNNGVELQTRNNSNDELLTDDDSDESSGDSLDDDTPSINSNKDTNQCCNIGLLFGMGSSCIVC